MTMLKILLGVLFGSAVTTFCHKKHFEKKLTDITRHHRSDADEAHSSGFHAGWDSAKQQYNYHPHLYCKECFPPAK